MKNFNSDSNPPSDLPEEWHEPYFTPAPPRMFDVPASGSIEIYDRYSPRVRFAGTLWRFKIYGPPPSKLTHKQPVTIIGRQGNCLFIEV